MHTLKFILRTTILLCVIALFVTNGFAYRNPNSLYVGVGALSISEMSDYLRKVDRSEQHLANTSSPVMYAGYQFRIEDKVKIGVLMIYEQTSGYWQGGKASNGLSTYYPTGTYTLNRFTPAMQLTIRYHRYKWGQLYTNFGFGVAIKMYQDRPDMGPVHNHADLNANFYYSPLGVLVGHRLAWFAEGGFGYKGLLNTGLVHTF